MQLNLDFTPGLTDRFRTLTDAARHSAYTSAKPLKAIAADMDQSQSDLSRKLSANPDDVRRLSVEDLVGLIESTGDMTPIYWLLEKFHLDDRQKMERAATEFMKQLPQTLALLKQMGVKA